jgi:hypothetical protein
VQTAETTDSIEAKLTETAIAPAADDWFQVAIEQIIKLPGNDERRDDKQDVGDR